MLGFLSRLFGSGSSGVRADDGVNKGRRSRDLGGDVDLNEFVRYVARALVDNPDGVQVNTEERDRMTVIRVSCDKGDIGKIIGRSGKTIAAIRALVTGAAGRSHRRVNVEVMD